MVRPLRLAGVVFISVALSLSMGCGDSESDSNSSSTAGGDKNDTGVVQPADTLSELDTGAMQEDAGGQVEPDSGVASPDIGEADAGIDVDGQQTIDVGGGDDCPGGAGCDCEKNDDCDQAVCIQTADGKKCAKTCVDSCEQGWTCANVGGSGTDPLFVCVPNYVTLCAPCQKSADCELQGVASLCLDYGDGARFCGGPCKIDGDCPSDYVCEDAEDGEGVKGKQCKRKDGAQCACSKWAVSSGQEMACEETNTFGTCAGKQHCVDSDKGPAMSPCDASTPKEETCDDVDNDCDGKTDVLPESATCFLKAFLDTGSKSPCKTGADCGVEGEDCEPISGVCKALIGECQGTPVCTVGGKTECTKVKTPKPEICNLEDDDCDGVTDESFGWKDPVTDDLLPVGAACGVGPCAGGTVKCASQLLAQCDTAAKQSPEKCDGVDNDCDGKTDDEACDDGDACTNDACDGKSCSNDLAVDCDDKNQCTADSCDKVSGACVNKALTGSCDDGDACTVGDVCGLAGGVTPTCEAGKVVLKCDDKNPCTDDSCQSDKGCVQLANAVTLACYGGDPKTKGVGVCKGGVQYCKGGVLGAQCVGEVSPNKIEACDNLDDDCDGKTDEGCKPTGVDVSFAAAFGTTAGKDKELLLELGGSSPTGEAVGAKKTGEFGFIAWVLSLLE